MARIGRNEPCPCGSGKKFKRCCGSPGKPEITHQKGPAEPESGNTEYHRLTVAGTAQKEAGVPATALTTEFSPMGLSGQEQRMSFVPVFADPDDPRNVGGPQGLPGDYKVTFVLARPGVPLVPEREYKFSNSLGGNSHLAITEPAFSPPGISDAQQIRIYADSQEGHFEFFGFPNKDGFLGKIETRPFHALDITDAQRKAYRALAPSLSNWSLHLDIPLHVFQIDTVELRNSNVQMTLTTPFWEAPFSVVPQARLTQDFLGFAGLYREALNSNSPVYRYLCLFKIIDGLLQRRRRLGREARAAQRPFSRPPEVLPGTHDEFTRWLNGIFPIRQERGWDEMALSSIFRKEVRGKRFKQVIDSELYPLRNDVAHALSSGSGELKLSADEMLHTERVNKWLPLTKCIVRRMLKNEFPEEFLTYLREDGTITGARSRNEGKAAGGDDSHPIGGASARQ
jgi:hypothetical protein